MSIPHNPYEPPAASSRAVRELSVGFALTLGCLTTLLTYGAASLAGAAGLVLLARILAWPSSVLLSLVPPLNIGTPENPIYEGTPLHMLAWLSGILVAFVLYSVVGYFWLRSRRMSARP